MSTDETSTDETRSGRPYASQTESAEGFSLWPQLRPLLLRLHFYAGILVGPFLVIAAVTGLICTMSPQLSDYVHRHELTVDRVGTQSVPLGDQVRAARTAHPEGTIAGVRPPISADGTTRVVLAVDDVPEGYERTVFVDPYTAEVRGALTTYGEWLPVRAWIDELHRNLHLGEVGRHYSELAASWLWIVALGGLALWVGKIRRRGVSANLVLPERGRNGRSRLLSWHGVLGVWIVAALLLLSATGLTWSRYAGDSIAGVRAALDWTAPSVVTDPRATGSGHDHDAAAPVVDDAMVVAGLDGARSSAMAAGLQDPMSITPPASVDSRWSIEEVKRNWPTRYDSVAVDASTGAVVDRVNFDTWPLMAKMTNWTIDAHMGILFGLANQILLALTALGLITLVILGYRMWWLRRPTRATGVRFGPPARRGALRRIDPVVGVVLVAGAAAIGWYLPLWGLPLLLFLAVDVAAGIRHRRIRNSPDNYREVPR